MKFFEWILEAFKSLFSIKENSNENSHDAANNEFDDETGENLDFSGEFDNCDIIDEPEKEDEHVISTPAPYKQFPKLCVCLDNGHGENTGGKCSPWVAYKVKPELYFREYKFNREVTERIVKALSKYGIEVYLTCPELTDISLTNRYKRANAHAAEHPETHHIFISVHANAAGNGKSWLNARGWSAWTTKGQNNSDKLAECLYDAAQELLPPLGQIIRTDKTDGDRDYEENFTVIYGANMPAVLTENLFYDNVTDVKFLLSEEGKDVIADIHVKGIIQFAEAFYKM